MKLRERSKKCANSVCNTPVKVNSPEKATRSIPVQMGNLGVRAQYLDGGIVLYKDYNVASGYFNINHCPICGRRIDIKVDSELVPLSEVLCDMSNPDGGPFSWAAKDYYYQHYASDQERKAMDRKDKIETALVIIFMIAFWAAVGFVAVSSLG